MPGSLRFSRAGFAHYIALMFVVVLCLVVVVYALTNQQIHSSAAMVRVSGVERSAQTSFARSNTAARSAVASGKVFVSRQERVWSDSKKAVIEARAGFGKALSSSSQSLENIKH